jgi:serine protease Do
MVSSAFLAGAFGTAAAELAARLRASVVEVQDHRHGVGAGTIWQPDGLILTNHHVVPGDEAQVVLADGRRLAGRVVGRDQANDLAAVRVDAVGLPAVEVGDARRLRVGELVLAVGHTFGLRGALTVGVVSAAPAAEPSDGQRELIRADLLLGPGNSGGPLADARGRVVGLNAMVSGGLALAVPSHLAASLVAPGSAPARLGLGLRAVRLGPGLAALAGSERAALVVSLAEAGPAGRAGLLLGDVVVGLDGQPLDAPDGLLAALRSWRGGPLRLRLLRGGRPLEVAVLPETPASRAA